MSKLLYITASEFSGTTLLSFLLNRHPAIATVGHTMGWSFDESEEFRCSCGERISDCPLFRHVAEAYRRNGLEFKPNDFGTAFKVSDNDAVNYYLTEALPKFNTTFLELARDTIVRSIPAYRKRIRRQIQANTVFVDAVLDYWKASCYLDNSHSPYRLRRLAKESAFDVFNLHLIRDPRGVVLSLMRNSGLSLDSAIRTWLRRQKEILRICAAIPNRIRVHYEELCLAPNRILGDVHRFLGVECQTFTGDFKDTEHHILGNRMRLSDGAIRLDEKWKREMTGEMRDTVDRELRQHARAKSDHGLATIIEYYLSEQYRHTDPD